MPGQQAQEIQNLTRQLQALEALIQQYEAQKKAQPSPKSE
jgi:hypothetical protein